MRIKLTSIMVDNQDKALKFYTEIFGFVKKHEMPAGEYRWLTVVSPDGPDDLELSLEPNANPAGKTFQEALFKQGIPLAAFEVSDVEEEFKQAEGAGRGLHTGTNPNGSGHDRRVFGYVRQPDPALSATGLMATVLIRSTPGHSKVGPNSVWYSPAQAGPAVPFAAQARQPGPRSRAPCSVPHRSARPPARGPQGHQGCD